MELQARVFRSGALVVVAVLAAALPQRSAAQAEASVLSPITEPFLPLHGNNRTGNRAVPVSPDPLVATTWSASTNLTNMQSYEVTAPAKWTATPESSFENLQSLASGKPKVTVSSRGTLRLDFAVEHAAWIEFDSPDLGAQFSSVTAAISEYNEPWQVRAKVAGVKAYDGTYRLETNAQLYEGVRFAWIIFEPKESDAVIPWHITGLRLVSMVKPVNYSGSFNSSDLELSGSWYSGAYGSRLNMMPYGFNSILIDRGDRVSIQGDGKSECSAHAHSNH
jgi:alpha-L-rhamnosidase